MLGNRLQEEVRTGLVSVGVGKRAHGGGSWEKRKRRGEARMRKRNHRRRKETEWMSKESGRTDLEEKERNWCERPRCPTSRKELGSEIEEMDSKHEFPDDRTNVRISTVRKCPEMHSVHESGIANDFLPYSTSPVVPTCVHTVRTKL